MEQNGRRILACLLVQENLHIWRVDITEPVACEFRCQMLSQNVPVEIAGRCSIGRKYCIPPFSSEVSESHGRLWLSKSLVCGAQQRGEQLSSFPPGRDAGNWTKHLRAHHPRDSSVRSNHILPPASNPYPATNPATRE